MAKKSKTQRAKASAARAARKEQAREAESAAAEAKNVAEANAAATEAPKRKLFKKAGKSDASADGSKQAKAPAKAVEKKVEKAPEKKPKKRRFGFLKDVRSEMKRVTWPTKQDVLRWSVVVVVALVFFGVYVAVLDNIVITPLLIGISSIPSPF